jgi:hypothetical protein
VVSAVLPIIDPRVQRANLDRLFDNVTVICFNYDRCIEHYLVHALSTHYRMSAEDAKRLVLRLRMLRPYGSLGGYLEGEVKFGNLHLPVGDAILTSLRTYTEKIEDKKGLRAIRVAIAAAEVIVFMGNAYHPNNMRLLGSGANPPKVGRIYGTRAGIISDADLQCVKRLLPRLNGFPKTHDARYFFARTCTDLFEEYSRSLRE